MMARYPWLLQWTVLAGLYGCAAAQTGDTDFGEQSAAWQSVEGPVPEDADRTIDMLVFSDSFLRELDRTDTRAVFDNAMKVAGVTHRSITLEHYWLKDLTVGLRDGTRTQADWGLINERSLRTAVIDAHLLTVSNPSIDSGGRLLDNLSQTKGYLDALDSFRANVNAVKQLEKRAAGLAKGKPKPAFAETFAAVVPRYVDGGDIVSARMSTGEAVVLVGEHTVAQISALLARAGVFSQGGSGIPFLLAASSVVDPRRLDAEDEDSLFVRWGRRVVAAAKGLDELIAKSKVDELRVIAEEFAGRTLRDDEILSVVQEFRRASMLPKTSVNETETAQTALAVTQYIEASRRILAQWLKLPEHRVTMLPNITYHLDIFLKPLVPGKILMPDPALPITGLADRKSTWFPTAQQSLEYVARQLKKQGLAPVMVKDGLALSNGHAALERSFFQGIMGKRANRKGCNGGRFYLVHSSGDPQRDLAFKTTLQTDFQIETIFLAPYARIGALSSAGVDCAALQFASSD